MKLIRIMINKQTSKL